MTLTTGLPGRETQLQRLADLVDQVADRSRGSGGGAAVAVVGEAGAGKTAVFDAVGARARDGGYLTLRCTGLSCEAGTTGAGLHELLHGVLDRAAGLPADRRAALDAYFGRQTGPQPNRLILCLATLELLEELARTTPVLILVDDLQWLDQLTIEVLTFVARRLRTAAILVIAGVRSGGPATDRDLPWPVTAIELPPLPEPVALVVIRAAAPDLDVTAQRRILDVAEGNPLALREFAAAFTGEDLDPAGPLPATRRLTGSLLAELDLLPRPTRRFLVLVAASDRNSLPELMPAAIRLGLRPEDLDPAERSGALRVTGDRLHFRRPLLRHAVYAAATWSQRSEAHAALADTALDADRATWHRSALACGDDEDVAGDLEQAAGRAVSSTEAVRMLRRAAALSPDAQSRAGRLAGAAEMARQGGYPAEARELIDAATALAPAPPVAARLIRTRVVLALTEGLDPATAVKTVEAAVGDTGTAPALAAAGALAWHLDLPGRHRDDLRRALAATEGPDTLLRMARTWVDPLTGAADARRDLASTLAGLRDLVLREDTWRPGDTLHRLFAAARTAQSLHDLPMAVRSWDLLADALTVTRGAVADEARRLAEQAPTRVAAGRIGDALDETARARALGEELGLPWLTAMAVAGHALASAWAGASPATPIRPAATSAHADAVAGWAAGLHALREDRHADAYAQLVVLDHQTTAWNAVGDLAEAAAGTEEPMLTAIARDRLIQAGHAAEALDSDHLRAVVLRGRAVLDGEDDCFTESAAAARRAGTPLELARTLLAHGTRLRRTGSMVAARGHLGEAHFLFVSAGAGRWAQKAAAELRAAGVAQGRPGAVDATDVLSADRSDGGPGDDQPGDRGRDGLLPSHDRQLSLPDLPEAGDHQPGTAARGAGADPSRLTDGGGRPELHDGAQLTNTIRSGHEHSDSHRSHPLRRTGA